VSILLGLSRNLVNAGSRSGVTLGRAKRATPAGQLALAGGDPPGLVMGSQSHGIAAKGATESTTMHVFAAEMPNAHIVPRVNRGRWHIGEGHVIVGRSPPNRYDSRSWSAFGPHGWCETIPNGEYRWGSKGLSRLGTLRFRLVRGFRGTSLDSLTESTPCITGKATFEQLFSNSEMLGAAC
jgi:hypothetical protein